MRLDLLIYVLAATCFLGRALPAEVPFSGEKKLNNLVSELLVDFPSSPTNSFTFTRRNEGWVFVSALCQGEGAVQVLLSTPDGERQIITRPPGATGPAEAMRYLAAGRHTIRVQTRGEARVERIVVWAIPELIHCGLGFDPAIKGYGRYDLEFLKKDILSNINALIIPNNLNLPASTIDDWHGQGKKFIAEVGISSEARTAQEHARYWTGFYDRLSFVDGIIMDEFIVNRPIVEWVENMTAERQARFDEEKKQYQAYGEAIQQLRSNPAYRSKMFYGYVGGSGKRLNQEIIGTNLIRTIINSGSRVALERYLHEMSSEQGSKEALETFVDGIADWEAKEPGVEKQMIIAFGLMSMPPGSLNKQPNVDYHVWMDQQMHVVANHPKLAGIAGLEWWTSSLADEETVRFVGKLYRHYAIEGKTERLTHDPLFLSHLRNPDFAQDTDGWTLHSASEGSMAVRSFPRYGRIEGRFMGLGRPADPEHIGDTFLWMKRNPAGPNIFSQVIQHLESGRRYSMKMLSCDYQDLVSPKEKKREEANPFVGSVNLEDVQVDSNRSFTELYPSSPEPKIPVWITYHWKVFTALKPTAQLTVSDWPDRQAPSFGQEQAFNFVEIEPYHD